MKIKNKIFLCVCSFILMFCTMFSFMSISKADKLVVSADSVVLDYSYTGSNFYSKVDFPSSSFNMFGLEDAYYSSYYGVTVSVDDSQVVLNGRATQGLTSGYASYMIFDTNFVLFEAGTYYLSFDLLFNTTNYLRNIFFEFYDSNDNMVQSVSVLIYGSPAHIDTSFTLNQDCYIGDLKLAVYLNDIYDNFTLYNFMLTQDSSYPPFQPYSASEPRNLSFKFDFLAKRAEHDYDSTFVDISPYISDENSYWLTHSDNSLYNTNHFTFDTNAYGSVTFPMHFVSHNRVSGTDNYITDYDLTFTIYTMINKIPSGNTGVFDSNITRIVFGSYLNGSARYSSSDLSILGVDKYNFIAFYNSNGLSLDFIIPLHSSISSDYFDYRTYYLNDNYDDNGIYMDGYKNGYNTAKEEYTAVGYDNGYKFGYNTGYNNGFSDGTEDSNQYTFLNLISATIDAPITYFQELFNFELLGVNLQGFLTGLFTLCVIVTIIKLCLGG